ncbi:MAG: serine/threonine protein kinase [Phycisphaerales bacterium]|nr:serine/threonine protein kinase [Phycisphaerales bacterium]MCB9863233.1 serine/threonine protein kinase [Phycisphaerales bacterium]
METTSLWFDDEELLVREIRRGRRGYEPPAIPGYDDLHEIRRGGQGIVFVALQASTRRRVAIKLVLDGALATRDARRRFEREVELVATLRHPNIVRIYDSGETGDGRLYYVMDYIEGVGLDEFIDDAARSATQNDALAMFAKICDGVQYAHQQGVIHRDLKPSNVRIDRNGEPHVLDFGLAKSAGVALESSLVSHGGGFMGSLPWASPEQADGATAGLDVRSDVYSLGVILYQLLTGDFPYRVDGTLSEALERIRHAVPRSPREIRRDVSDDIATIALKCLTKESDRRYQSAGALAADVRRFLAGEPIEAKRDSAWYSVRKTLKRYQTLVRVIGASLVIAIGCTIATAILWRRAVTAEQLAASRLTAVQSAHAAEVEARQGLEAQVDKTRRVAGFLDSTMRAVDPWKHPGSDIAPLREMLDAATERLRGAFADQPEVEAALAGTLGWDYWTLGLYDAAEPLLRRSYELNLRTLGEEHTESLASLSNLALFLTEQGNYSEAEGLFEHYLAIQKDVGGMEKQQTLVTLNNLANNLDWQGRSVEAEAMYRVALEAQTRLFGPNDANRLDTLNNLATCIPANGKGVEAEQLYKELIAGRTAAFGADHPETLQARMNHAQLVNRNGRVAEAERLLRDVLASIEAALGPNHPLAIVTTNNLASAVSSLGRIDEGLALSRRAFEAQVAFAGPDHPSTLVRKSELVATLIQSGQWDEAIPTARELLAQDVRAFGENDWRTLIVAGNLAYALNKSGQTDAAESVWKRMIATNAPDEGAASDAVISAYANLGALYADQARWSEAEPLFRSAIAAQVARNETDHWRTAYMRYGLGRVLFETDRIEEAEGELLGAYQGLSAGLGDDHEKTQQAIGYLVRLYERKDDAASSRAFGSKLLPK